MRDPLLLATLALTIAAGCGPSDDGSSAARQTAAPPVAESVPGPGPGTVGAVGDLTIASIEIGRSLNPDHTMHDATFLFIPTDEVWISVAVDGTAPRATLQGRFLTAGGEVVGESTQEIKPSGRAMAPFHLAARQAGWPLGRYRFELQLNGVAAGKQEFEIRQPPL